MIGHRKMDAPDSEGRLDEMAQGVLGGPLDRPEGPLKVTGRASYAAEWSVDGMAHGVLVRATIACGRIRGVDRDHAMALPGVLAVITDPRLLRNPAQGTLGHAPVQGPDRVFYFGQPIALVVAESFEEARHAAQNLRIDYVPERGGVFDAEDPAAEPERPEDGRYSQGDLESAMREAAFRVEGIWRTPGHNSAPMEPHASLASWEGERLTLRGSYQMLGHNRAELADSLGIAPENLRILAPYVGGGFGSKLGIAPEAVAAAVAARELRRPVRVVFARQQVFEAGMRRSETRQRLRLAADREGRLLGIGHEFLVSQLPDEPFSEPVGQATHFTYAAAHRLIAGEIARINRTCAGSVRAPGEAVGVTAFENATDELAEAADLDPLELRLRNLPERDPETGKPFSSHKLAEALREGARLFGWDRRAARPGQRQEGEWLIGMGTAAAIRVNHLKESRARVTLLPDGAARVETDMTDIGTGTYAILTQIAAEMLGLSPERVSTQLGDTEFPRSSGSGGSWGAGSSGSSVYLACEALRGKLAEKLGCAERELTLKDGRAIAGNRAVALRELLDGAELSAQGHIEPGKVRKDVRNATYGAHFAEVAVSRITGETRVRRMTGVFAAGRLLNEKTARSQCYGGMIFGIGMALTEELIHDARDGHIVNRDLAEYHLPVNLDVPQIEVSFLEERDPYANPMQAKGIGELGICGAAASVTNAIYNACGQRIRSYPATLDKVLAGLS